MTDLIPVEFQAYVVIGTIILLFISLFAEWTKPPNSFLFAVLFLVIIGILKPEEVLEGMANESIISIVLLILITAGIRANYNLKGLLDRFFSRAKTYRHFLGLMMAKVALLSSFVNNTPVVVLMTPYVFDWGKKNNVSPSKLLIPLSYSTIVGGMITIIGTSTTLVLNGFLRKNGLDTIHTTQLLIIGGIVAAISILFLMIFSNRLLPSKQDLIERFEVDKREYLIEKRLSTDSKLIGQSVRDGGLRSLKGVYLVEIVRNNQIISPVNPEEIIEPEDVLIFAGNTDTVIDLTLSNVGIELPPNLTPSGDGNLQVVEAVISASSSLLSKTIKESNFRERYDAAVVAIHRNGERLSGKIGRMKIKSGDVLLMYTGNSFMNKVDLYKDLYIISGETKEIKPSGTSKKLLGVLIAITSILMISQAYSLFTSLLIISTLMVAMKLINLQNLKRDIDLNMLAILILSLALGEAMIKTGGGTLIAEGVINALHPFGNLGILIGLAIITTVLTSFITNIGAIAIAFPLAFALTTSIGIDGTAFYLTIAFAASAAFITPIGYQTNLIVYGPGGYSFKDFLKIGLPMTIIYLVVSLSIIITMYNELFF